MSRSALGDAQKLQQHQSKNSCSGNRTFQPSLSIILHICGNVQKAFLVSVSRLHLKLRPVTVSTCIPELYCPHWATESGRRASSGCSVLGSDTVKLPGLRPASETDKVSVYRTLASLCSLSGTISSKAASVLLTKVRDVWDAGSNPFKMTLSLTQNTFFFTGCGFKVDQAAMELR